MIALVTHQERVARPVPVSEMFSMIDFTQVRWGLIQKILPTWVGMVREFGFVVLVRKNHVAPALSFSNVLTQCQHADLCRFVCFMSGCCCH